MSQLHVLHIQTALEQLYSKKIDMKDYGSKPDNDKNKLNAFLSRSLAAYALSQEARIDAKNAAASVVDGGDDSGIDAIYWDQENHLIYLVQSKWINSGDGSPNQGDVQKFIKGFHNLLDLKFDRFNEKVRRRKKQIKKAIADPGKAILILTYTGTQPLSVHVRRDLDDLLKDLNDPTPVAELKIYSQKELHNSVIGMIEGEPVDLGEVMLHNWNQISEPFLAYYGQIDAEVIATWWDRYGTRLFESNLRKFIGNSTDVNAAISSTLAERPERFWYYNNGITMLCKKVEKSLSGGADRSAGTFICHDASIINGAQTVGCIGETFVKHPEQVRQAHVMVRLIDLEKSPPEFAKEVARATNTQNRMGPREFVSLDPQQERLRIYLLLDGKEYVYKTGDEPHNLEKGCDLTEATVALACINSDLKLAVDAKREISKMWDNIETAPYKQLFNEELTSTRLWRAVEIHRIVNSKLKEENSKREGRDSMIAVFGNLFILHQVFKKLPVIEFDNPSIDFNSIKELAAKETVIVLNDLILAVSKQFSDSLLQPLFKNKTKCLALNKDISKTM